MTLVESHLCRVNRELSTNNLPNFTGLFHQQAADTTWSTMRTALPKDKGQVQEDRRTLNSKTAAPALPFIVREATFLSSKPRQCEKVANFLIMASSFIESTELLFTTVSSLVESYMLFVDMIGQLKNA